MQRIYSKGTILFLILFLFFNSFCFAQIEDAFRPLLQDFPSQSLPKMTKGDYYSLSGKYFNSSVLDGLPYWHIESQRDELIEKLTPEIRGLYVWMYLDGHVSNGGFSQFFENGFGYMIPEITQFFKRVGDHRSIKILKKAKKWNDDQQPEEVIFDLTLSSLDKAYLAHSDQANQIIEAYIRTHSELFITDEEWDLFPENFTGKFLL